MPFIAVQVKAFAFLVEGVPDRVQLTVKKHSQTRRNVLELGAEDSSLRHSHILAHIEPHGLSCIGFSTPRLS